MTNTNQSLASGDVEAREAALKEAIFIYNFGATHNAKNFRDPVAFHAAINYAINTYLLKLTSTKAEPSRIAEAMPLAHRRNCGYFDQEIGCTCCLKERTALRTEQEMHAAWRKRAEEAERHITDIEAENATLARTARALVTTLDQQLGTPCEQIRHAQEIEDLKADRDRMREALEKTEKERRRWAGRYADVLGDLGYVDWPDYDEAIAVSEGRGAE